MIFTKEEKQAIVDKIEQQYFQRNFGSLTKTEWETFLFSVYLAHCRNDDTMSFDDYTLSKQLGITQSRIRSLKERVSVKFANDTTSWKEAFVRAIPRAAYFPEEHTVKLLIQEKDVLIEVRHLLESRGLYDERSLNDKLLCVSIESFLEICFALSEKTAEFDDTAKSFLLDLQKTYEDESKNAIQRLKDDFSVYGLKAFSMEASKEVLAEVLDAAQQYLPGGSVLKAICNLAGVIKKA